MALIRGVKYGDPELDGCGSTTQAILEFNNIIIPLCSSCLEELVESIEEFKNTVFCHQCKNWMKSSYDGNTGSCKKKLKDKGISVINDSDVGNICWSSWMDTCEHAERKEEDNGD